jgi:hypothetical protein
MFNDAKVSMKGMETPMKYCIVWRFIAAFQNSLEKVWKGGLEKELKVVQQL